MLRTEFDTWCFKSLSYPYLNRYMSLKKMKSQTINESKTKNNRFYLIIFIIIIPLGAGLTKYFDLYCKIVDCEECSGEITLIDIYQKSSIAINKLSEIEKKDNSNLTLDELPQRYEKLIEYYKENNDKDLFAFENLMDLNLVIASAGIGKSMFYRESKKLLKKNSVNIQKISLNEICNCHDENNEDYSQKAQLKNNSSDWDYIFNSLPYSNNISLTSLLARNDINYDSLSLNYLVIDDCDEWHPQTIDKLITEIYNYTSRKGNDKNWKFILLGRAEGFRFSTTKTNKIPFDKYKRFYLTSPVYKTTGDIMYRIKDYKNHEAPHIDTNLVYTRLISKRGNLKKFILRELQNLQGGNYLIEEYNRKDINSIQELKDNLFAAYLKRNMNTHCRPGSNNNLYLQLLRQVALKYQNSVDSSGFFRIKGTEESKLYYCINDDKKLITVNEQDLFEYSGIIALKPINSIHTDYSFSPIWIHKYLIDKQ